MIAYATTALSGAGVAHGLQTIAMDRAFRKIASSDYLLMAPPGHVRPDIPISDSRTRLIRYLDAAAKAYRVPRGHAVFTRDVGLAWVFQALGHAVCYEIHSSNHSAVGMNLLKSLKKRSKFIAISDPLSDYLITSIGVEEKNILVAHDGAFPEDYRPLVACRDQLRKGLGWGKSPVAVYTGTLAENRGLDHMWKVAEANEGIEVLLIGKRQGSLPSKVPDNLTLGAPVSHAQAQALQVAADVVLYPPITTHPNAWCASPLKLFEYMASNTPIVISPLNLPSGILDETMAYFASDDTPEAFAAAVTLALLDPNRDKRAAAARRRVSEQFTWETRARKIAQFLTGKNYEGRD